MNTSAAASTQTALQAHTSTRLSALALASVMTVVLWMGMNGLASSEVSAAQLALQVTHQVQQPA